MQVTFQEVVGGARKLLVCACYAHMRVCSRLRTQIQCAKVFTCKIICGKIFANGMHWRNRQNFLLAKISAYAVLYTLIPFLAIIVATKI